MEHPPHHRNGLWSAITIADHFSQQDSNGRAMDKTSMMTRDVRRPTGPHIPLAG
jgi:hypothetical protein